MYRFLLALSLLCCTAVSALAQTAITLPIAANAVADLGNGPIKVRMIAGNASIFTSQSSGVGSTSGSSTTLTLTATPTTPPLVGGLISGAGITSGTTVTAYNGTTGITLSAAMTVAGGTTVSWGAACPASAAGIPAQYIQASAMADYYMMYTQARVCAVSPGGPVNTLLVAPVFQDGIVAGLSGIPRNLPWYNLAGTGITDSGIPVAPVGGMTLLAAPTGTGDCINSACKLPTACSFVRQIATFLGSPNLQLTDGTYTTGETQPANTGNQCNISGNSGGSSNLLTSINGNAITPANVVIAIQSGQNGFTIQDGGEAGINNLTITNVNGGGAGIAARQNAVVDYAGLRWGAWGNSGSHVAAFGNAVVVNPGNETLLAGTTFLIHWNVSQGAYVLPGGTTTLQSSVAWSGAFANVNNANMDTTGWTLSGTGTGTQFNGSGVGYLNTAGSCPFPGTGGCVLSGGFQDSANDASSFSGVPIPFTRASNAISSNVSLNNTANYFDGPSMAQGTTGTWWATGMVTLQDSNGNAAFRCKLWDGTTIISSGEISWVSGLEASSLTFSGFLTSPAANIKISCRDITSTGGQINATVDGVSNTASKISGFRIQ